MIYIDNKLDFEPNGYTPFDDQYTIFVDTDLAMDDDYYNIIGTANLLLDNISGIDCYKLYINYIESYQEGGCSKIINFLMNCYENLIIAGEAYNDLLEFWGKLGANFDEDDINNEEYLVYFTISKDDFKKTKYYKEIGGAHICTIVNTV